MATTTVDSTPEVATDELFSSLVSDIKTYNGKDPLLPWLRGIRKMKNTLSPDTLKEKLPRFLQKCAQAFETDRRYRNDMRYLRVWLHLMDFVDDPRTLLRTMEVNHIGTKRCQFYQAYALYYEKNKKYDEAEKMYHLGVKNLAEPVDELQKSYEQFLQRMERKKNKRIQKQELKALRKPLSMKSNSIHGNKDEGAYGLEGVRRGSQLETSESIGLPNDRCIENKNDEGRRICGDDMVVVNFVDTAIVGRSEAEAACHHGLVDPTINMKEAMNAINSMFREPLEAGQVARKLNRNRSNGDHGAQNGFEVLIDENTDKGMQISNSSSLQHRTEGRQSDQEPLQIYIDDEGSGDLNDEKDNLEHSEARISGEDSASQTNSFVFTRPKDLLSESSGDMNAEGSRSSGFREDTVVCRFVGSTISDEPQVENVCHHGLVDPTINLKEAMDDINNMFGKPIDFVRSKRSRKQEKAPDSNIRKESAGFSILADDDLDHQRGPPAPKLSGKSSKSDLFEPTVLTKEAMDDINKMFNMPLNF